jgi:hypothetical protein
MFQFFKLSNFPLYKTLFQMCTLKKKKKKKKQIAETPNIMALRVA